MKTTLFCTLLLLTVVWTADAQTAAQTPGTRKPGPTDNLVPTPNPVQSPVQSDAGTAVPWRRALHEKYEGKFPGPTPRTPDGKPDLNGVWLAEGTSERPALTPTALTVLDERFKKNLKDYPYSACLPAEPTAGGGGGGGIWLVMHNRTHLVTVFELPPNYRQVFLDGRPHPTDPDPTWMGHSIGTWEGDTLIVDSVGFNDKSWLRDFLPHTTKLHIRERWTRTTMGSMTVEMVYEDPETFVTPWKVVFTLLLAPGENVMENICENNRFLQLSAGQNP
jgi:hypothetical protein